MADLPLILILSDDNAQVGLLTRVVSRQYQVKQIATPETLNQWLEKADSVEELTNVHPEMLVADTELLAVSVHNLCQQLRCHPNTSETDLVVIGDDAGELESDALNSGAIAYLPKPLDERLVHARLMVVRNFRDRLAILNSMSHTDSLTMVGNRRRFDESFDAEWKWASRHNLWLGVLLIDADYFKRFNDEYGHLEGDRCLVTIAKALKSSTKRAHDLLARYGGEEFVAIVPAANPDGIKVVAERMRKVVCDLAIPHRRSDIADVVTVSIGGACCRPRKDQNRRDLLLAADEALYDVKHGGRNNSSIRSVGEE
ncbi:MAG: hypothetical protein CMI09_04145 [Oceanospirillaceae bacterium]|nr:hypothetical protein [Oceanospirillaceae bacterium]